MVNTAHLIGRALTRNHIDHARRRNPLNSRCPQWNSRDQSHKPMKTGGADSSAESNHSAAPMRIKSSPTTKTPARKSWCRGLFSRNQDHHADRLVP